MACSPAVFLRDVLEGAAVRSNRNFMNSTEPASNSVIPFAMIIDTADTMMP